MDLPVIDPQKELIFTAAGLMQALKVSRGTFYKYVNIAGIEPHRKRTSKRKYYTYEQAMQLLLVIYPPQKVFKLMQKARREASESRQ